jgi:hypothetical protein
MTARPCQLSFDPLLRRPVCGTHLVGWPCREWAALELEVRAMRARAESETEGENR